MKENWFNSMLMENGKISHKRWIAVSISAILAWGIIFALVKASGDKGREAIVNSTMIFILVMSGVATIAQITGLITRTPPKEEKTDKPEEQKTP